MTKRILIDIDGTVADWERQFITLMQEHSPHIELFPHGTRTVADREREQEIRSYPETQTVLAMPDFYRTLKWYEGAKEAILRLDSDGYDVFFCSMPSRINKTSASEKIQWVEEGLGSSWIDKVVLTYRKDVVGADILIDDHVQPRTDTTEWQQILYLQSYNKHIPGITRFNNWEDYDMLLETINQAKTV